MHPTAGRHSSGVRTVASSHGVADEDMLHAVRNAVATEDLDDGLTMFIGPARDATAPALWLRRRSVRSWGATSAR